MSTTILDSKIKEVSPVHGVSVGDPSDKSTWRIDFKAEATQAQRDAAQAVVDGFDFQKEKVVADLVERVDAESSRRTAELNNAVRNRGKQMVSVAAAIRILRKETKGNATGPEIAKLNALESIAEDSEAIDTAAEAAVAYIKDPLRTQAELDNYDPGNDPSWP